MNVASCRTLRLLVMGTTLSLGCATSYSPREPGRLHFVSSGKGESVLEKDGQRYSTSAFSGDLIDAVAGNAAAATEARTCVRRQRVAGGLAVTGGVALIPAYLLWAESITGDPAHENRPAMASAAVALTLGALVAITSAVLVGESGIAHCYDAINIYNDGVSERERRLPTAIPAGRGVAGDGH